MTPGVPRFDPAREVQPFELDGARDVIDRLLDGGAPLAPVERHALKQAATAIREASERSAVRARRRGYRKAGPSGRATTRTQERPWPR